MRYSWTLAISQSLRVSVRNAARGADLEDTCTLAITITGGSGRLLRAAKTLLARLNPRRWSERRAEMPPLSLSIRSKVVSSTQTIARYSLYTPELNLMAETAESTSSTPPLAYDYIWFGGLPVAQVDVATSTTHWTFTDHLGTPIVQTDATGAPDWRVEYEPYGTVVSYRQGATRHQTLRFPGQEYDSVAGEREYNIFRWYREGWGRYPTADPLGFGGGSINLYAYAGMNPLRSIDPFGLVRVNITPFQSQIVDNDTLRRKVYPSGIGGQEVYGAFYANRTVGCNCECSGGSWRAKVTINVGYQIWASTCPNCPRWPSVTTIITEEEKHVGELLNSTKDLVKHAQNVESLSYPAKFLCEIDCRGLKVESLFTRWWPGIREQLPGLSPHSHDY